jgi:hypothetical protein
MAVAALKHKPKLKTFHATLHVTRVEECTSRLNPWSKHATCWLPTLAIDARSGIA